MALLHGSGRLCQAASWSTAPRWQGRLAVALRITAAVPRDTILLLERRQVEDLQHLLQPLRVGALAEVEVAGGEHVREVPHAHHAGGPLASQVLNRDIV